MDAELLPLPPEFSHALAANGGQPLFFEDPATLRRYQLAEAPLKITLDEEYINKKLDEGLAAIEAGDVVPWDPERIKRLGRELFAARRAK